MIRKDSKDKIIVDSIMTFRKSHEYIEGKIEGGVEWIGEEKYWELEREVIVDWISENWVQRKSSRQEPVIQNEGENIKIRTEIF